MKGIILAGGSGTRLYPLTKSVSKQILPIYDKPMIYYPLSVLMLAGIRDILIISTPRDISSFKRLLSNGEWIGLNISYEVQENPNGLAESFIIGKDFIKDSPVALILGDNIFYGQHFGDELKTAGAQNKGATIFGYYVKDPSSYGVIEFDNDGKPVDIVEKPKVTKSHYAVPGLYFYDNDVVDIASGLKPSDRGELEITDVNKEYLKRNSLAVSILGRGMAWFDTGTHASLVQASNFVETIQNRQSLFIGCIEEVAYRKGYIDSEQLLKLAKPLEKTDYGSYLIEIVNGL